MERDSDRVTVFAYGSNLCRERLAARIDTADYGVAGYVRGRRLRFHKLGSDGSAKADAYATGRGNDRLWGVVFRCSIPDKARLDRIEGLGVGYRQRRVEVIPATGGEPVLAWTYHAAGHAIDPALRPFDWYREYVLAGAVQHGLPADHVAAIRRVPVLPDPDRARAARHALVVPAM